MDANKGATYAQALRLAKLCEPYNLAWFEDPVLQADVRLMARLRSQTTIPIAAGSTATSDLVYLREYLVREAVDYLQPNVRDIGGYTQGLKAAALAQAFNIPLAMGGNYPHLNMHLHGGVPNGGRVEFHWQGWKCVESLFDNAPGPVDGWRHAADGTRPRIHAEGRDPGPRSRLSSKPARLEARAPAFIMGRPVILRSLLIPPCSR